MLNVLFAYKTFDDVIEYETDEERIEILAENMLFITRDFSTDLGLTAFGKDLITKYFDHVPENLRAKVFLEYIDKLNAADDDFNVEIILTQAATYPGSNI